ncbi:probable lactoylglutathione lyase, chloroplastic [Phoenix dactylifera]|uniref:Lactoylglutathione lyase n=1 Tax=Phoenix dactylifera TaxID=42345 RepID=A0A8B7CRC3_PHODC|nr:probable lactoylglutathione lyase, chloroplastic [Phoenix dactylifera]
MVGMVHQISSGSEATKFLSRSRGLSFSWFWFGESLIDLYRAAHVTPQIARIEKARDSSTDEKLEARPSETKEPVSRPMMRILPMAAASSSLQLAALRPRSPFSSAVQLACLDIPFAPCRPLALFHLGSAMHHEQLFGIKPFRLIRKANGIEASAAGNTTTQASTTISQEEALEWVKKDKRRLLHVVYHVGDLDKTIKFYTECLGMKLLRKRDIPEERYTNAFLGYGPEDSHFVVELTYNYGVDKYDIGTGFGHFGIAVEDVTKTVDLIKAKGGKVTREPGPVNGVKTVIAFIEDPDGYKFQLLERGPTPEPLCQVMLHVGDFDRAINFYEKAFGMELLCKRDSPEYKCTIAMMGYGPEDKNAVLELTYNYGVKKYNKGNAYAQIAIGTDDVYKTAEAIKLYGGKITREPGPLPGINTKITACLDPDGWKTVFVDNIDFAKELE